MNLGQNQQGEPVVQPVVEGEEGLRVIDNHLLGFVAAAQREAAQRAAAAGGEPQLGEVGARHFQPPEAREVGARHFQPPEAREVGARHFQPPEAREGAIEISSASSQASTWSTADISTDQTLGEGPVCEEEQDPQPIQLEQIAGEERFHYQEERGRPVRHIGIRARGQLVAVAKRAAEIRARRQRQAEPEAARAARRAQRAVRVQLVVALRREQRQAAEEERQLRRRRDQPTRS